jgi:hypothetical protein
MLRIVHNLEQEILSARKEEVPSDEGHGKGDQS